MKIGILFTSCVSPNTTVKTAVTNPEFRLIETRDSILANISRLTSLKQFDIYFYVIDSSYDVKYFEILKSSLGGISTSINFKIIHFDQTNNFELLKKGKGFSELQIINRYIIETKNLNFVSNIKISGRYSIVNICDFLIRSEKIDNYAIKGSYSVFLKRFNTVVFAFNSRRFEPQIKKLSKLIDDSAGVYLEKLLPIIFEKEVIKIKYYPEYDFNQLSGSTGKKYYGLKNHLRKFIYRYL